MPDIPFHSAADSVAFQQPIVYAKAAPSETMIARLFSFDETGTEHLLGEYTFNHTRTIPGSGAVSPHK
jgi:anaerobic C4-dicarboxylate transporter